MLILTRRIGESIVISDNIVVAVLGIRGGQVRLGINAPIEVSVHREEIHRRILEEKNKSKEDGDQTTTDDDNEFGTSEE